MAGLVGVGEECDGSARTGPGLCGRRRQLSRVPPPENKGVALAPEVQPHVLAGKGRPRRQGGIPCGKRFWRRAHNPSLLSALSPSSSSVGEPDWRICVVPATASSLNVGGVTFLTVAIDGPASFH